MRKSALQKLVMNVLAVSRKDRTASNEAPDNRKHRFENRQAEGDNRYGNRDDRRRLLCPLESQRAQHESDKQASAIPKKDGRRAEVETEKAQSRACKDQGHESNQRRTRNQRNGEHNHRRKQSGTGG